MLIPIIFDPFVYFFEALLSICSVGLLVSYVATCASNPTYGVATYLQFYFENISLIILSKIIPHF